MSAAIQKSIFEFKDRFIPKVPKYIQATDFHGEPVRMITADAEATVSAINGQLSTKGSYPRFMVEREYIPNTNHEVKDVYIRYWIHLNSLFYHCNVNYRTGEIKQVLQYRYDDIVNGKIVKKYEVEPVSARIEGSLLLIDDADSNTYSAIIDDHCIDDEWKGWKQAFNPKVHTEHLLLHLFINGARGDELAEVMAHSSVYLDDLSGFSEHDCAVVDIAKKYGIDLVMPTTVMAWSPEHYPIQESCKNCSRDNKGVCQINWFRKHRPLCCTQWHWDGSPFKKLPKKSKKDYEDEDEWGDEE